MRPVDFDVIVGLHAQPLSDEVEEMAMRFGVHLHEGGSSAKRRRKHETRSLPRRTSSGSTPSISTTTKPPRASA